MKRLIVSLFLPMPAVLLAESLVFKDDSLQLVDSARYCYLPFVPVYQAHLFRSDLSGGHSKICLRLDYERVISAQTLARATRKTFVERHGDEVAASFAAQLDQVDAAYQDVSADASYLYCMTEAEGVLSRDSNEVLSFSDTEFAQRFMQIWLENPQDAQPNWQFRDCS